MFRTLTEGERNEWVKIQALPKRQQKDTKKSLAEKIVGGKRHKCCSCGQPAIAVQFAEKPSPARRILQVLVYTVCAECRKEYTGKRINSDNGPTLHTNGPVD
jgi:hypothetical protein